MIKSKNDEIHYLIRALNCKVNVPVSSGHRLRRARHHPLIKNFDRTASKHCFGEQEKSHIGTHPRAIDSEKP